MKVRKKETVCEWIGAKPDRPTPDSVIGLAIDSLGNGVIHGLRHPAEENTNDGIFGQEIIRTPQIFFRRFA
ncbi:MAG: hypothetical protein HC905_19220 [Bacteroidales bacterium]|nr:hypothetical protein [Bacteroidales bacterium]